MLFACETSCCKCCWEQELCKWQERATGIGSVVALVMLCELLEIDRLQLKGLEKDWKCHSLVLPVCKRRGAVTSHLAPGAHCFPFALPFSSPKLLPAASACCSCCLLSSSSAAASAYRSLSTSLVPFLPEGKIFLGFPPSGVACTLLCVICYLSTLKVRWCLSWICCRQSLSLLSCGGVEGTEIGGTAELERTSFQIWDYNQTQHISILQRRLESN